MLGLYFTLDGFRGLSRLLAESATLLATSAPGPCEAKSAAISTERATRRRCEGGPTSIAASTRATADVFAVAAFCAAASDTMSHVSSQWKPVQIWGKHDDGRVALRRNVFGDVAVRDATPSEEMFKGNIGSWNTARVPQTCTSERAGGRAGGRAEGRTFSHEVLPSTVRSSCSHASRGTNRRRGEESPEGS